MRTGLAVDATLRATDSDTVARRERVIDLIRELAEELHHAGLIRDHADPSDSSDWVVRDISTCRYDLCVDALAAIKDITAIATAFPLDRDA